MPDFRRPVALAVAEHVPSDDAVTVRVELLAVAEEDGGAGAVVLVVDVDAVAVEGCHGATSKWLVR